MFSRLLIPTDLTPVPEQVIECVCSLVPLGARAILLLHALGIRHLEEMAPAFAESVSPRLRQQAAALERTGLPVELLVVPGVAHVEIGKIIADRHVSAVVLRPEGTSLLSEVRMGTITLATLHRCTAPVVVARGATDAVCSADERCGPIARRIMHPTDFSDCAEHAFAYVRELVQRGIESVTLLHVQDRERIEGRPERRLEEYDHFDHARLDRLAADLKAAGAVYVHEEIACGSPVDEIVARSAEAAKGLVVMGTHARGVLPGVVFGSVSHAVARRSSAPVLLVPQAGVDVRA